MPSERRPPPVWLSLLQYFAVRALAAGLAALPFRLSVRCATGLALLVERVDLKHRRIALRNVSNAYPGMPPEACRALVRRVYAHLATMLVEMIFAPRLLRRGTVERYMRLLNREALDRALRGGRGVIAVIGHLGGWEATAYGFTLTGYPLHTIARPLDNPYLSRYLNRFRTGTGQGIVSKYNALRQMGEFLKGNKLVVFLADQDARRHGLFVPFFGRPASTVKGPAVAALRYQVPLIPVNVYREGGPMRFVVEVHPPIEPPADLRGDAAVRYLVEGYTRAIEGFVRQHPDQWLWVHRRWKTRPPGEGAAAK